MPSPQIDPTKPLLELLPSELELDPELLDVCGGSVSESAVVELDDDSASVVLDDDVVVVVDVPVLVGSPEVLGSNMFWSAVAVQAKDSTKAEPHVVAYRLRLRIMVLIADFGFGWVWVAARGVSCTGVRRLVLPVS